MSTKAAKMIFTMGLPGAGKSTAIKRNNIEGTVIDPDAVKESHPDYDPKNPAALHEWSKDVTEKAFLQALADGEGVFVIDGTGTNAEKMARKIKQAQSMGFVTEVLYVRVKLSTALKRNASRERVVPEHIVREKAADITTAFEIVSMYADETTIINND